MSTRRRGNRLLSDVNIRQGKGPRVLHDGGGLYIEIDEGQNKRWILRLTIAGKRTRRGLGSYPTVGLAHAREEADRLKRAATLGLDVRAKARGEDPASDPVAITFEAYFKKHFDETIRPGRSPRFAASYYRSIEQVLFPSIGHRPIAEIRAKEVIDALRPIWHLKPERARRALQRASAAFESAITNDVRSLADPTRGIRRELGTARPRVKHRPSLPWQEAPAFIDWLRARPRATLSCRLALMMIVFTGLRSEEVRLGKWGEINFDTAEWCLPAFDDFETGRLGYESYRKKRMKTGLDHIVPISTGAMQILSEARRHSQDLLPHALIFPGVSGNPLSDNSLSKLMRDGGFRDKASPHGFRATLKTWCAEHGVRDEVSEYILSHGDPNLVRAAYRRATYLDERRDILQRWSDFLRPGMSRSILK